MTHMREFDDDEGKFNPWKSTATPCRQCRSNNCQVRQWDSNDGAFEDWQYQCLDCKFSWWVDGIDS